MHFDNLRAVLRTGADTPSRVKLALAAAITSRPWLRPVGFPLLRSLSADSGFWVRYHKNGAVLRVALRPSDLNSDLQTFYETGCGNCYCLPQAFEPEIVIDAGANVGLFTLLALTLWPKCRVIACEPDPRNLKQLQLHLRENGMTADIVAGCLAGRPGAVRFYCRAANQGSFDSTLPFHASIEVPVTTLGEVCRIVGQRRCLVKLDIEGAEIQVLKEFLSVPRPNYFVVGELHDQNSHKTELLDLIRDSGWRATFVADAGDCVMFHAHPAAQVMASQAG